MGKIKKNPPKQDEDLTFYDNDNDNDNDLFSEPPVWGMGEKDGAGR
jgi:hypothetical protein